MKQIINGSRQLHCRKFCAYVPLDFADSLQIPLLVLIAFLSSSLPLQAEESKGSEMPISYYRDIRPIFQRHCQGCHQPAKKLGEYAMTSYDLIFQAGESEDPPVVPGKPDESSLVWQIVPFEGDPPAMPKNKPPLIDSDVAKIKKWIAQGAKDDTPKSASQLIDGSHPPVYQLPPVLTALEYSPDGQTIAVSGYHEVLLHKADGSGIKARLVGLAERIESVAFSPDGKSLAVAGGTPARFGEIQVWNVESGQLKFSLPVTYDTVYGVSWSPDGSKIAFGCTDNTLRAIDSKTGEQVLFQGAHDDWVLDTVFSEKGTHLVSVSRDRSMKLTEVSTQRFVDNITSITPGALKGGLQAVDRHPTKDELLIGGADGIPKLYKMFRTQARRIGDDFNKIRFFEGMPGRVFAVCFNQQGSKIAAASSHAGVGEVRVYETETGKKLATMKDHQGAVFALSFHPTNDLLASAGFDGTIRVHDAQTGELKVSFDSVPLEKAETTASTP